MAWLRPMSCLRGVLLIGLSVLVSAVADDRITSSNCNDNATLQSHQWTEVDLRQLPIDLGTWRIPVSSSQPYTFSEATVQLEINQAQSGNLVAMLRFAYPIAIGLLFNFQGMSLDWNAEEARYSSKIEWARSCQGLGKTLIPGKSWSIQVDLGEKPASLVLDQLSFRLWGSQN
jgi:hypothetical protein